MTYRRVYPNSILWLSAMVVAVPFWSEFRLVWSAIPYANDSKVQVQGINGTVSTGVLNRIDEQFIDVQTASGAKQLPLSDADVLTFPANKPLDSAPLVELTLADGSRLRGTGVRGKGNEWQIETTIYDFSTIPAKAIRSLTFRPMNEKQISGWNDALSDPSQNDGLVVTRPSGEITRVGGTILEIKNGQVFFEFDDQKLEMPSEKLLGLIWFQPNANRRVPAIEIRTVDQSQFQVSSLKTNGNQLEFTSPLGLAAKVSMKNLMEIRLSGSNLRWLAEAEKIEATEEKPSGWKFSIDAAKQAFLPRFVSDSRNDNAAASSDLDLLFSRPGTYSFRMPEGFKRLESRIQRSEVGTFQTKLSIQVWQDAEKIFEGALEANQDFLDLKVTLTPEKKIRLVVASTEPTTLGTEIQWKQPRLLR